MYGYVTFAYDSTTKKWQAKKRYKYSYTTVDTEKNGTTHAGTYTEDTAFSAADYYVNMTAGVYKLVASASSPDGHLKLLLSWPPKLPQAGRIDYGAATGLKAIREAASLSL